MRWRVTTAVVIMILSAMPSGAAGQTARERIAELMKPRFGPLHPDTTSRPRSNQALEAFRKLEKDTGAKWKVQRWSNTTGGAIGVMATAKDVKKGLTTGVGASPREKAENFVTDYWRMFLPVGKGESPIPEFRFLSESGWNIRFQQYSQGLPVFQARLGIGFFYGSIKEAGGTVFVLPEVDVVPALSADDALDAIRVSEYGSEKTRLARPAELVIYPSMPPRLMWSMQCTIHPTGNHASKHLLVDAKTGEIFDVTIPPLEFKGGAQDNDRSRSQPNPKPRLNFRHDDSTHAPLDPTEFFFTLTDTSDFRNTAFGGRVGAICDRGPATQDRNISRCFRVWPLPDIGTVAGSPVANCDHRSQPPVVV